VKRFAQMTALSAAFCLSSAVLADTAAPTSFTPVQTTAIEKIVHDYLVTNPEVLVEASKTLQAQQQKKMESEAMTSVMQNKAKLFDDAQSPSVGDKAAPVAVVEFFDYQCGHCREMQPQVDKLIQQDKSVRVIFKELPIFGGASQLAAKAALAAAMQPGNKYYAFHNALFGAQGPLNNDSIMAIAKKEGLDAAKLQKDMNSPVVEQQLKSNFELAQALHVMGTPTFVIGNKAETKFKYIPGATSLDDLKKQINAVK
jgi:protein-disulfide isomerase